MADQKEMTPEEQVAVLRGKVAGLASFALLLARIVLPDAQRRKAIGHTLKHTETGQLGFVHPVGEEFVEAFQLGFDDQLADLGEVLEKDF